MIWTVTWLPDAEDELARIWISAGNRQAITDAAARIDKELRRNADQQGVGHGDQRLLHKPPLMVIYEVFPNDRIARIVQVIQETN
jgi:hypothetical protein